MKNEIKVNVKLSPEYLKRLNELRSDMKAYGRKQVWEECTCKNCKWWNHHSGYSNKKWDCFNDTVEGFVYMCTELGGFSGFKPREDFGCNQWEARDE